MRVQALAFYTGKETFILRRCSLWDKKVPHGVDICFTSVVFVDKGDDQKRSIGMWCSYFCWLSRGKFAFLSDRYWDIKGESPSLQTPSRIRVTPTSSFPKLSRRSETLLRLRASLKILQGDFCRTSLLARSKAHLSFWTLKWANVWQSLTSVACSLPIVKCKRQIKEGRTGKIHFANSSCEELFISGKAL